MKNIFTIKKPIEYFTVCGELLEVDDGKLTIKDERTDLLRTIEFDNVISAVPVPDEPKE